MSIKNRHIHISSLILAKLLRYSLVSFVLVFIVPFSSPFKPIANAECYATSNNCSSFGENYYLLPDQSQCSLDKFSKGYVPFGTICCCSKNNRPKTSAKYLLISSVVAFFAILTAVVYFYKKNE